MSSLMPSLRYSPQPGGLLYHYCPPAALHAILLHRSIRHTSLRCMNDSKELSWALDVVQEMLESGGNEPAVTEVLMTLMKRQMADVAVLSSCFSTEADKLSQWRAYADNGAGFCIGFGAQGVFDLPGATVEVCYDKVIQRTHLHAGLSKIFTFADEKDEESLHELIFERCAYLIFEFAGLKNPAFSEEGEVRKVYPIALVNESGSPRYTTDVGKIQFYMRGSTPVPYLDLAFPKESQPVKEIWIGPRAGVCESEIAAFVGTLGYEDVKVRTSVASYR